MKKYVVQIIRHLEAKLNCFVYLNDILCYISRYRFLCLKVKINGLMDTFRSYFGDQEVTRVYTRIADEFNSLIRCT